MNQTTTLVNIGTWSAKTLSDEKGFSLRVEGEFPTNGEKPLFELTKEYPQGPNETELILTLSFFHCIDPNGKEFGHASDKFPLEREDQYKTVMIIGSHEGETIATNIEVIIPK
ncbi:hypothetical protein [Pontibacter burrus]|uniref:Uncharacterized protein n=1 Tax=Pontibacter burrus TaxID=2704466 RepID=A0A6B3LUK9_9BACT|nr:hypothetical protein [Pontibacter burrus]NEM97184.1 hypothetical protein [Pontibacter burrus]